MGLPKPNAHASGRARRALQELATTAEAPTVSRRFKSARSWRRSYGAPHESLLAVAADNTPSAGRWTRNDIGGRVLHHGRRKETADDPLRPKKSTWPRQTLRTDEAADTGVGRCWHFSCLAKGPQRQVQKPRPLESWGATGLSYRAAGRRLLGQPRRLLPGQSLSRRRTCRIVTEERRGQLAWDLYAGVGLFSRQSGKEVPASRSSRSSRKRSRTTHFADQASVPWKRRRSNFYATRSYSESALN